jgi:hypothetical protein
MKEVEMNRVLEIMVDTLENKDLSDKQKVDVLTILLNHIKRETSRSELTDKGFETQGSPDCIHATSALWAVCERCGKTSGVS